MIPVIIEFNAGENLCGCVNTVLNQICTKIESVFVSDCINKDGLVKCDIIKRKR